MCGKVSFRDNSPKRLSPTFLGIIFIFLLVIMILFPFGAFVLVTSGVGVRLQVWVAYRAFVVLIAFAWMALNKRDLKERGFLKATETITDVVVADDVPSMGEGSDRRSFSPVLQFLDKDGNLITVGLTQKAVTCASSSENLEKK